MKLSVAPLSTRHFKSGFFYLGGMEIGTFIERKRSTYTELQLNALTQAIGFRRLENPHPSTLSAISDFLLRHFLPLLRGATCWLVRGGFAPQVLPAWLWLWFCI